MIDRRTILRLASPALFPYRTAFANPGEWALWRACVSRLVTPEGRVIDYSDGQKTTSEGQAYCLFFALVAGEHDRFARILAWTEAHLAGGDLMTALPAWLYAAGPHGGPPAVRDTNSAADADLWLAYTLLEAGRLWHEPRYTALGLSLSRRIAAEEVAYVPGLGPLLLPGPQGFQPQPGVFLFNPSYLPLQLTSALADFDPSGPWSEISRCLPVFLAAVTPSGFPPDWATYRAGTGFRAEAPGGKRSSSGYEAIRVYLWAGMLNADASGRDRILRALRGPLQFFRRGQMLPARVSLDGKPEEAHYPLGYSAALLPYFAALNERSYYDQLDLEVKTIFSPNSGKLWQNARYYDLCLALFARGWADRLYRFGARGSLILGRRNA